MISSLPVRGQNIQGENLEGGPPRTDGAPQTSNQSASAGDPRRDIQGMILTQSSGSNPWAGSEEELNQFRETGQQINKQALSQATVPLPNRSQVLFDTYVTRKLEVKKQRDEYKRMIKTKFDQFQKTRYKSMTYNGINTDFTAFNQGFMSIKRR